MAQALVPVDDLPSGVVPLDDLPGSAQAQARSDPVSGSNAPSILGDLIHFAAKPFKEFGAGVSAAFAPQYNQPNTFDRTVGGALGVDPMTLQKYVSTPVDQVLGLLRGVASPTALLTEPMKVGATRASQLAGLPENVSHGAGAAAELGSGVLAPQGLANAIPKTFAHTGNVLSLLGARVLPDISFPMSKFGGVPKAARPVLAAERTNAANLVRTETENATNILRTDELNQQSLSAALDKMAGETAFTQRSSDASRAAVTGNRYTNEFLRQHYTRQLADYDKSLSNVAQLESKVARYGDATGEVSSPLAKSLYATEGATDTARAKAAYAKFDKIKDDVAIQLPTTQGEIDKLLSRYGESVAPSLKPKSIVNAATGLGDVASERQLFVEIAGELKRVSGSLSLANVQTNMQGLGKLTRSADKQVASDARQLYWSMMADAEASGNAGKTFLAANRAHRQNMAADTIAERIASPAVTAINSKGELVVKPEGLANWLKQDSRQADQVRKSFASGELRKIFSTLDDVFQARKAMPGKPTAPKLGEEIFIQPAPTAGDARKLNFKKAEYPKEIKPDIITPEAPTSMFKQGHGRFAVAGTLGSAILAGFGLPAGGAALSAAYLATYIPNAYSKMIFNAAMTDRGRDMLRAIYKDAPPSLRDVEKIKALRQYLESQNIGTGGGADVLRVGAAVNKLGE